MSKTKALGLFIIALQLGTLAVLGLSLYTLFNVLSTAISAETFSMKLNIDERTGDWVFTLDANPKNTGVLDVRLSFRIAVVDLNGQLIAENSKSVYIEPGGASPFSLSIVVPAEIAQTQELQENKGAMEVTFSVRTLGDLVGFTNVLKIEGEGGT